MVGVVLAVWTDHAQPIHCLHFGRVETISGEHGEMIKPTVAIFIRGEKVGMGMTLSGCTACVLPTEN